MVWRPRVSQTSVCVTFGAPLRGAPVSLRVATLHGLSFCAKAYKTNGILTNLTQHLVKPMKYQQFSADPLLSVWETLWWATYTPVTNGMLAILTQHLVKPMQYRQFSADTLLSVWRRCGGRLIHRCCNMYSNSCGLARLRLPNLGERSVWCASASGSCERLFGLPEPSRTCQNVCGAQEQCPESGFDLGRHVWSTAGGTDALSGAGDAHGFHGFIGSRAGQCF